MGDILTIGGIIAIRDGDIIQVEEDDDPCVCCDFTASCCPAQLVVTSTGNGVDGDCAPVPPCGDPVVYIGEDGPADCTACNGSSVFDRVGDCTYDGMGRAVTGTYVGPDGGGSFIFAPDSGDLTITGIRAVGVECTPLHDPPGTSHGCACYGNEIYLTGAVSACGNGGSTVEFATTAPDWSCEGIGECGNIGDVDACSTGLVLSGP